MSAQTTLCLVRHGETDWNVEKRLQGHRDISLNVQGEAQAKATALLLSSHHFSAVYTSDLTRASRTAKIIAGDGRQPIPTVGLRERHYGDFQGLTYHEASRKYPQAYARFESREPEFAFPGGGESLQDFHQRVVTTLNEIVARHPGANLLLVTHGGVLDLVHRLATGKPLSSPRDFQIPNAALNWISHDRTVGWRLQSWSDISHLDSSRDELPST